MDVVWDGRSDGSRDEAGSWDRSKGRGNFGANVRRTNVSSGEFDRACSKITLG